MGPYCAGSWAVLWLPFAYLPGAVTSPAYSCTCSALSVLEGDSLPLVPNQNGLSPLHDSAASAKASPGPQPGASFPGCAALSGAL